LHPNAVPERPWQFISINLIVKLPESNGFDSIAVIVDLLSNLLRMALLTARPFGFFPARNISVARESPAYTVTMSGRILDYQKW
jgi:hypothetical protein